MTGLKNILLLLLCCLYPQWLHGQQALTFQVLISENAHTGNKSISQFDNLLPGDTVVVEKSGYLAVISNYFHSLEVNHDTLFVLPDFGIEEVGDAYKRPDLQGLLSNKRFNWRLNNGVEHASYFMDLLFPLLPILVYSDDDYAIPVIWNDNRDAKEKNEKITVKITDMFFDDITEFQLESDSICLNLNYHPQVLKVLREGNFAIVNFYLPHLNGREFAVKLSKTNQWQPPFAACAIDKAVNAVALALFLEYNHGYFRDGNTEHYYHLATKLSSNPQYVKFYELYKERRAR